MLVIAVIAAAAFGEIRSGEIIYSKRNGTEKNTNQKIISDEYGIDLIIGSGIIEKYEYRSELIVNINTATEEDMIRLLPGIGVKRAAAIVEYREISGGFSSVEELCEVDGIGEKLLEELRPFCTIEGPSVQYAGKHESNTEE